mmetsp:Transcript_34260/g.66734  ORF Transcript_34260/g.66734 Transcript_34260/m.66734 type:complete len:150 (-) Transcript_34260:295-744(-)
MWAAIVLTMATVAQTAFLNNSTLLFLTAIDPEKIGRNCKYRQAKLVDVSIKVARSSTVAHKPSKGLTNRQFRKPSMSSIRTDRASPTMSKAPPTKETTKKCVNLHIRRYKVSFCLITSNILALDSNTLYNRKFVVPYANMSHNAIILHV